MTAPVDDELSLVAAAAAGDSDAFNALYARHAPAVVSLAAMRLRDRAQAHDVTQNVFLKLHQSLSGFRGEASVRTWLVRVTLNCCTDYERRQARHVTHEVSELPAAADIINGSQEDEVVRRVEGERVRAAVESLPDDLRVLVSLRYDAELPYAEIAASVGLPMGTVATRLARALRLLHARLGSRS